MLSRMFHTMSICGTVLLWVGCVTLPLEERPWAEVSTQHLTIMTDLNEELAVKMARELEWFHNLIEFIMGETLPPSAVPVTIILYRDERSFYQFVQYDWTAGIFHNGAYGRYLLVNGGYQTARVWEAACHEYVHLAFTERGYPAWYNEGLAMLLSELRLSGDEVEVGRRSRFGVRTFRSSSSVRLRDLLSKDYAAGGYHERKGNQDFHGSGWGLTHFLLLNGPELRDQLYSYLQLRSEGVPYDQAFGLAFGLEIEDFEPRLHRYLTSGHMPVWRIPLADLQVPVQSVSRSLARDEVLFRLGVLASELGAYERAGQLLRSAIEANPQRAEALARLGLVYGYGGAEDQARTLFERAATLEPGNARVHALYGDHLLESARSYLLHAKAAPPSDLKSAEAQNHIREARVRYQRSLELDPGLAAAQRGLGLTYLRATDDLHAGIQALATARQQRPKDRWIVYGLAVLLARTEQPDRAVRLFLQARELGVDPELVAATEERLAQLRNDRAARSEAAGR